VGFGGIRVNLERVLESGERVRIILLSRLNDTEKVVSLDARRMQGELFLYFLFSLLDGALAQESLGFLKRRSRLRGWLY
jgi:hypothetical protein